MLWIDVNTACRHWLEMAYFCRYLHQWSQTASVLLTGLLLSVWTCVGWQLLTQSDQLCQERCQQGLHSGWQLVDPLSRLFCCLSLCQSPRLTPLKPRSALFWKSRCPFYHCICSRSLAKFQSRGNWQLHAFALAVECLHLFLERAAGWCSDMYHSNNVLHESDHLPSRSGCLRLTWNSSLKSKLQTLVY